MEITGKVVNKKENDIKTSNPKKNGNIRKPQYKHDMPTGKGQIHKSDNSI